MTLRTAQKGATVNETTVDARNEVDGKLWMRRRRHTGARSSSALAACALVAAWSLAFAAPHLYWAAGGRAGLGVEAAAADAALARTPFFVYNLAAAGLAIGGAIVAVVLAESTEGSRLRRPLVLAARLASAALLLRGAVGVGLLGISVLNGTFDAQTPILLLVIEPWFLAGGLAFAWMASRQR